MMKKCAVPIVLLAIFVCIASAESTDTQYQFFASDDPIIESIWRIVENADMVVDYTFEGKLDIKDDVRHSIPFELEELEFFFEKQKYKELIVVWFDKRKQLDAETTDQAIEKLNRYFFKHGYKRVVLLQGMGDGVGLYSDRHDSPQN